MKADYDITIDEHYQALLKTVLGNGKVKKDRTGTGTQSIFGYTIKHDMAQGFPLLTTKKIAYKSIITELRWFLKGDTNIKYLVDNDCNIWNGDAFKNYCKLAGSYEEPDYDVHIDDPNESRIRLMTKQEFTNRIKTDNKFANKWGELGPIYGSQWRSWRVGRGIPTTLKTEDGQVLYEAGSMYIDQIKNLIEQLKTNPDSRRLLVSAWNPGELTLMLLPPCHYGFQMYTTELTLEERQAEATVMTLTDLDKANVPTRKISLIWNQRSCDVFLGLPFNIASYALLLKLIAAEVNMIPDQLIGNLGDTHLYLNHIEQAKEQISRDPMMLSKLTVSNVNILNGEFDVSLNDYVCHPTIKAPLSN